MVEMAEVQHVIPNAGIPETIANSLFSMGKIFPASKGFLPMVEMTEAQHVIPNAVRNRWNEHRICALDGFLPRQRDFSRWSK